MSFLRPTAKERDLIRVSILMNTTIEVFSPDAETWTAEISTPEGGVWIEAESAAAVLREIAAILEEA